MNVRARIYVCAIFFIIASGLLFSRTERLLTLKEKPEHSDAIVILLGGIKSERVDKAANLFQHAIAHYIVFGTGFQEPNICWEKFSSQGWSQCGWLEYNWSPGGQRYAQHLAAVGIPKSKMIQVATPDAYDTESELRRIITFVRMKHWHKITLVTSQGHSRRAKLIWNRLAPDIAAKMVPADDPLLRNWWRSKHGRRTVSHEFFGYLKEAARQI